MKARRSPLPTIVYLLALVSLAAVLRDPGQTWGWATLVVLALAFGFHVHRSSQRWLDVLGTEPHQLSGHSIPWDVEQDVGGLRGFEFGAPVWWVYGEEVTGLLLSKDGTTVAAISSDDAGRGPALSSTWIDARLSTSRGRSIPLGSGEYAQNLRDTDLSELLEAHDDAVRMLSKVYGPPNRRPQVSLDEAVASQRRRRDGLRERRYRHTARALFSWYRSHYHHRLGSQLMTSAKTWQLRVEQASGIALWLVAIAAWVLYFTDESFDNWLLPLAMTLLFGAISITSLNKQRNRRRFL